jgi:putative ABC transport system ATP-binding protein
MTNLILEIAGLEHVLRKSKSDSEPFTLRPEKQLTIKAGSFTAIRGGSGCGKTTLLSLVGLLRKPQTISKFQLLGEDIAELWRCGEERSIEKLRQEKIGFALQSGELLLSLTVSENVAVPLRLNGKTKQETLLRVDALLSAFGITEHANKRINELSGGQRQRVVLARAIAHSPEIVFVDEPTSALDSETATKALQVLEYLQKSHGTTVVMITHDDRLASEFSTQIVEMSPNGERVGWIADIKDNTPHQHTSKTIPQTNDV